MFNQFFSSSKGYADFGLLLPPNTDGVYLAYEQEIEKEDVEEKEEKEKKEIVRKIFPETWIWDLVNVG